MNTFGKRLAKLRRFRKLTQKQLAKKLKISLCCISSWERGQTEPHLIHFVKAVTALKLKSSVVYWLLGLGEEEPDQYMYILTQEEEEIKDCVVQAIYNRHKKIINERKYYERRLRT